MVERFLRIQEPARASKNATASAWRTLPNCEKVPVWQTATAQRLDEGESLPTKLHIFHIPHVPRVARGFRVQYLGQHFQVAEVSNSPQLLGLELRCEAEAV